MRIRIWWARSGSNRRPRDYESPALTPELQARLEKESVYCITQYSIQTRSERSFQHNCENESHTMRDKMARNVAEFLKRFT